MDIDLISRQAGIVNLGVGGLPMVGLHTHLRKAPGIIFALAFAAGLLLFRAPAGAEDIIEFLSFAKAKAALPVDTLIVKTSKGFRFFTISNGESGDCGQLIELVYSADSKTYVPTVRHQFDTHGKAGCNPVSIAFHTESYTGERYIEVFSENYGYDGQGGGYWYDLDDVSSLEQSFAVPVGTSVVGASVANSSSTPSAPSLSGGAIGAASTEIGVLYVTSSSGGESNGGAIFASKIFSTGAISAPALIFSFPGGAGGAQPLAPAVIGPNGDLLGTTFSGGSTAGSCNFSGGCGVVYALTPPTGSATQWNEHILHKFLGTPDFAFPQGRLTTDADGNVYGTASSGGKNVVVPFGGVYKLTQSAKYPWTLTQLYVFSGPPDGQDPQAGVTLDASGNVFGTTFIGGTHYVGVVFELLKPKVLSDAFWKEVLLHTFKGGAKDGASPSGEVALEGEDVYGATYAGGNVGSPACEPLDPFSREPGCGVVYKLTPPN